MFVYLTLYPPGERQVWNLQPFTAEDFNIRTLADRIHDLPHLTHLYPDIPKDTAFGELYTPIDGKYGDRDGIFVLFLALS